MLSACQTITILEMNRVIPQSVLRDAGFSQGAGFLHMAIMVLPKANACGKKLLATGVLKVFRLTLSTTSTNYENQVDTSDK